MQKKYLTQAEALLKLQHYCAYQDRCHSEVRSKLLDLGVYGDTLEEVMADLITDNFLNEERFARSFVRGKFRIKKWGRIKIKQELKKRDISEPLIKIAFTEIDNSDYYSTLKYLAEKKLPLIKESDSYKKKQKLISFLHQKGYEFPIILEVIAELNL